MLVGHWVIVEWPIAVCPNRSVALNITSLSIIYSHNICCSQFYLLILMPNIIFIDTQGVSK